MWLCAGVFLHVHVRMCVNLSSEHLSTYVRTYIIQIRDAGITYDPCRQVVILVERGTSNADYVYGPAYSGFCRHLAFMHRGLTA